MSSFICSKCGAEILDTPRGYITGCIHNPLEQQHRVHCEPIEEELLLLQERKRRRIETDRDDLEDI